LSAKKTSCSTSGKGDVSDTIDWDRLIDKWGSQEIVSSALSTYFKDIVAHFDSLRQAVQAGHCESIASMAHALKGIGGNLYVEPLFDSADQLERAGRANDPEASTLYFKDLKIQIDKVISALSQCDWIETPQEVSRFHRQ
jgi:HPt (histidine-containing phosphotransfer) domain-containing protein